MGKYQDQKKISKTKCKEKSMDKRKISMSVEKESVNIGKNMEGKYKI